MKIAHNLKKKSYGRRKVAERFVQGNYRGRQKPFQSLALLASKVIVTLLSVGKKLRLNNYFLDPGDRPE